MSEAEQFVLDALARHERLNRFELMTMDGSPLKPKTSYHVLKEMEDKGIITSRLEAGHTAHRWYRVA